MMCDLNSIKINAKQFFSIAFLLLSGLTQGYSQQDPMYSIYLYDKVQINPAFAGSSNWMVGTLKYRTQFLGIPGQPKTQAFSFHAPIQRFHIGTGLKIVHENIAVVSKTNVIGICSYHLNFASGKLSFGLEGGVLNQAISFPDLIRKDQIDNAIPSQRTARTIPDASFGTYYRKKEFYLGFSAMHLVKSKLDYANFQRTINANLFKHYYFLLGNVFDLSESFAIEPSLLIKYVKAAPVQEDFNLNFIFKDKITVGLSYRSHDAVAGIFRVNITESFKIGYAYDHAVSGLSGYSNGTHEIFISYGIKLLPPAEEKEIHPRYYY
ncbi:MAG: type IX secretion system membrane protein PorP/SprF [Bacteroidetes bacterium]|nr:type IX secretion system membrane protein PorP/SprF [Bacteroidota bacterium]